MKKTVGILAALAAATLVVSGCAASTDAEPAAETAAETTTETTTATSTGSVLAAVQEAGVVRCGTRDALPGFAVLQEDGTHVGFDSDFCRAIAAAVLGDAEAVDMVDLETADRFTALQSGSIDVLVRNTTWTASRDGGEAATFLQTNFYDGQGMMVEASSGYDSVSDMNGAVVCVAKGTTTEGNAALESSRLGLGWEVRPFDDTDLLQEAFLAGQCDGWSSDVSQLTGFRSAYPDGADALEILPEVFSKEPLGPAVLDGDTQWAQAVNWAIFATIQAEEFGITSANVDSFLASEDVTIQRFLGVEITTDEGSAVLDPGLGLPTDFAYQVVKQVGNYSEIFERHLSPLGLERGVNALWSDGGLMYAPPYR
ncbi:amino acid ABC transporter substrate-binding protein [Pontimonas sp.]|jgi:general L-amino acid transport system substrate-binding protein|nr:amino acid ABC transporter substrate-binding protein [Pontimonas sp.]MDA8862690.1 amino acid ABC transporter substrate-binding protein [Pontimonas sp.]